MFVTAAAIALASCVNEDTGDCPEDGKVRLVVTTDRMEQRGGPADRYNIDCIHAYIFDADNAFIGCAQGETYTGEDYTFDLDLDPGMYHFVVWSNHGDTYLPSHSMEECHLTNPQMGDMSVYLQFPQDMCLYDDIPDLHHGILKEAAVTGTADHEFVVTVRPDTYKLNFTVKGIQRSTDVHTFRITDNLTRYDFENSIVPATDDYHHIRTATAAGDDMTASMIVLGLADDRQPQFDLENTDSSETLYSAGIVDMIKRAYATAGNVPDFSREFEFDIILTFDINMDVTVSVNGWTYTVNQTPLG